MKIAAILCWFDEPVDWLAGCVASLAKMPIDHLLAVDGPYALFPSAFTTWTSPGDQAAVIHETARNIGIGCTVHVPSGPWMDNEVEKRSFAFEYGRAVGCDWFFAIDADEAVMASPFDLLDVLENTDEDMLQATLVDRGDLGGSCLSPRFWRNVDGLRLDGAHYRYITHKQALGEGGLVSDVKIEHRHRPGSLRRQNQKAYYELRDRIGAEQPLQVA